jgi:hypothetical protein
LPSSSSPSSLPPEALQRYLQTPISLIDKVIKEKQAEAEQARIARDFAKLRKQQARRGGLIDFVRYFWHTLEPQTRKLIEGWPLEAVCLHLEVGYVERHELGPLERPCEAQQRSSGTAKAMARAVSARTGAFRAGAARSRASSLDPM